MSKPEREVIWQRLKSELRSLVCPNSARGRDRAVAAVLAAVLPIRQIEINSTQESLFIFLFRVCVHRLILMN